MYEWIIPGIAGIGCAVSWGFSLISRKHLAQMKDMEAEMKAVTHFFNWAMGARIVVRNKMSHENVVDVSLYSLYTQFQDGEAFKHAKLMYDNNEFKVYAQENGE